MAEVKAELTRTRLVRSGRAWVPVVLAVGMAVLPVPAGLAPHAWYFFAIFAGVIAALMLEPLPGGAVGLIGVVLVSVLARWTLFGPAELARPGFRPEQAALAWALSGFANPTVWLIFSAFMFALGYERTGLGRRLALLLVRRMGGHTLGLGYAVALADLLLAPFTPSNTARSGGTIFPVIRNLPALYGSKPHDPSARRIGSYLMWVAIAATSVTSSMFLTGLASNLLAVELVTKTTGITLEWTAWFIAFLPVGVILFALTPLLAWWLYPPEIKRGGEVPAWAEAELAKLGPISTREIGLAGIVAGALALWIGGGAILHPTLVALAALGLMVIGRIITWDDIVGNRSAWSTLAWFATLVAMADGLGRVGFVGWFAETAARSLAGVSPTVATIGLLTLYFVGHYLFASTTAHATALIPVLLTVARGIPGLALPQFALQLCLLLGLIGILTPYATGPSPIYAGSGYLPARDYWRLGAIFGAVYLGVFLLVGLPWMSWVDAGAAGR